MHKNKILFFSVLVALSLIGAGCTSGSKDAGVLRSLDGGKIFEAKNAIGAGGSLESRNTLRIVFNPSNTQQIIAGTQGGGFYFSGNQGESWQNVAFSTGNGNAIAIDATDQNILYLALDAKIYKSSDGGSSFKEVYTEQAGAVTDIIIDPKNHTRIIAITASGNFIVSSDGGETWKANAFIVGIPYRVRINPANTRQIYVATQKNGVYVSVDGGITFTNTAFEELQETIQGNSSKVMVVSDISIDPFEPNTVLIATDYGLIKTTDAGESYQVVPTLIIPQTAPLRSVQFHPTIQGVVFLSALNKFYTSTDLATTWSVVELSTSREVFDIAISPTNPNELYLAIKGEGKNTRPVDFIRFGTKE